ncbi:linear amide C-N hydrolase [Methylocystis sp.]|uniref:linear amide C-N hydrolase n=1 Tax=Methylocystis sp. TaxID=1911079 RepID=UPI0025D50943|nr:linear amide C-N hydrolase [Methylocystis sp.]
MRKFFASWLLACVGLTLMSAGAQACTRVLYQSADKDYIVGRTMDWDVDPRTNLWSFPRGMARDGGVGPGSIKWTSKQGSLIADFYDAATAEGVNEAGLVVSLLYLAEADYGDPKASRKPLLSVGGWAQYVLDNFASVAEAVKALQKEPFAIVAPDLPGGVKAASHMALADGSGDSAILEYLGGKLIIHHNRKYTVMTNSPPFDQQLALNTYWVEIGGSNFLPGTQRASDRFARASWNLNATPEVAGRRLAIASVFSIIRNVSVPLGIATPQEPNIASTRWRSVTDIKDRLYYFEPTLNPAIFWVDVTKLKLEPGEKPAKLDLVGNPILSGEVSDKFTPTEPFKFLSH